MPTLFPPEYPYRPDAPLLSFGQAFSEEISRSVIGAVWCEDPDNPGADEVRIAASLTMFEGFHPRDHLECMMAAQGVATHAAIMECFRRAMLSDTPEAIAIKLRSNVTQLSRTFSLIVHDLERRQGKALLPRPPAPPPAAPPPPGDGPSPKDDGHDSASPEDDLSSLDDLPEKPDDIEIRPDGTPGSFSAYAPKPFEEEFIPQEPPIMLALATRPKPWRMVNAANDTGGGETPAMTDLVPEPLPGLMRGPLDLQEDIFRGDAFARFASKRLDPDRPIEPLRFDGDEESVVELELISTGGDPELEAERQAMMKAHPEGKPIVTFRSGPTRAPDDA